MKSNPSKPLKYTIYRTQSLTELPKTVSGYRVKAEPWEDDFSIRWLKKLFQFITTTVHSNEIAQKKQVHRKQVIDFRSVKDDKQKKDDQQGSSSWIDEYPFYEEEKDDSKLVKLSRSSVQIVKSFTQVIQFF
jgi:hypothetical protein